LGEKKGGVIVRVHVKRKQAHGPGGVLHTKYLNAGSAKKETKGSGRKGEKGGGLWVTVGGQRRSVGSEVLEECCDYSSQRKIDKTKGGVNVRMLAKKGKVSWREKVEGSELSPSDDTVWAVRDNANWG